MQNAGWWVDCQQSSSVRPVVSQVTTMLQATALIFCCTLLYALAHGVTVQSQCEVILRRASPFSTWMGDHQRAGKQSAYDTEMVYPPVDDLPSSQLHVANMPK